MLSWWVCISPQWDIFPFIFVKNSGVRASESIIECPPHCQLPHHHHLNMLQWPLVTSVWPLKTREKGKEKERGRPYSHKKTWLSGPHVTHDHTLCPIFCTWLGLVYEIHFKTTEGRDHLLYILLTPAHNQRGAPEVLDWTDLNRNHSPSSQMQDSDSDAWSIIRSLC